MKGTNEGGEAISAPPQQSQTCLYDLIMNSLNHRHSLFPRFSFLAVGMGRGGPGNEVAIDEGNCPGVRGGVLPSSRLMGMCRWMG